MLDLEQNTICTANVLEAMREVGVDRILFSSTGSVYGQLSAFPTPEDVAFPVQTSLYGASKLACEDSSAPTSPDSTSPPLFVASYLLWANATHGHLYDFYKALKADPAHLAVLGDGSQEIVSLRPGLRRGPCCMLQIITKIVPASASTTWEPMRP